MLKPILLPVLLFAAGTGPLHAQTDYYARAGAQWASTLVRDVLVTEVTVQQAIAPMVVLGAGLPIAPGYRAGLEATVSSGGYSAEQDGVEADLGTLRTASLLLGLEGPVWRSVRWRVGLGGLYYWPAEDSGIFLQGGPLRLLAGAGADWRSPVTRSWDLLVSARYDTHRFTTDELELRGFAQAQGVSRVSLSIGLGRGLR